MITNLEHEDLDKLDIDRYSRQMLLEEIGLEGQKKLANARVLVIGAGGIGSSLLLYIAASGVGTIGIVDDDIVDISNLHRQVIHCEQEKGNLKVLILF